MKIQARFPLLAAALFAIASPVHAGDFGGPAPFRNGSPLVSGTDGVYQCVATGKNATGIITWSISNGVQTSTTTNNTWSMFIDGDILSGSTQANISNGKVAGVLDSGTTFPVNSLPTPAPGTGFVVIPGNQGANGQFTGRIDLNSPIAAIDGDGTLTGPPPRVDQILYVTYDANSEPIETTVKTVTVPGSSFNDLDFKIRGSRLSTTAN